MSRACGPPSPLPSRPRADLSVAGPQDQKLRKALQDYENEKWRVVAHKVGSGFTPAACRERAGQLAGEEPEHVWQSLSPKAASLPDSMEMTHSQRPW